MTDQATPQPTSDSDIRQTQAGAQTGGAQAGAGSAAQQAGTQTGQAQAGAGAAGQAAGALAQEETVSDVGQGEAYLINMKRLVENALTTDAHLQQILLEQARRLSRNAEDNDGNLRQLSMNVLALGQQSVANAVALANRVNNASVDLDTRIKQEAVTSDGRRGGNDEQYDKGLDATGISERERTVRGGDAGDVIRWGALSSDQFFQSAVEAAVAKAVQKLKAAGQV